MTIDRIGSVEPLSSYNKTSKTSKVSHEAKTDSISLSQEALNKADIYKMAKVVKDTPDVRADKIAEIKLKLQDPSYINDTVVDSVADGIMDLFGL